MLAYLYMQKFSLVLPTFYLVVLWIASLSLRALSSTLGQFKYVSKKEFVNIFCKMLDVATS